MNSSAPRISSSRENKKTSLYSKFTETSLAIDASTEFDQITELEAQVNYESFMKESSACETVYTSKISTLDFPRLLDYLL